MPARRSAKHPAPSALVRDAPPHATRPRAAAKRTPGLTVRDFLDLVHEGVRGRLGPDLHGLSWRTRFGVLQYWRGNDAVHFEVWAQRKTARLEIGLHFEGERDRNYAATAALGDRIDDVALAVGPEWELEEWTPRWTRLHRSFDAPHLTPELADESADQCCSLIGGMEPLLDELGLRA